jgi:hypothetical protein
VADNPPLPRTTPVTYALLGGLVAAALDIAYAIIFFGFRGVSAQRILQSVASGLLGSRAFEGGSTTALLGLALHFALMLVIALIFYFAARRVRWLTRRPYIAGAVYGVLVYWTMNLIVVPLSASAGTFTWHPVIVPAGLLVHIVLIGMPIAWAVRIGLAKSG